MVEVAEVEVQVQMEGFSLPVDDPDAYMPMAQDGDGDDVLETQCVTHRSAMTSSTSILPYPYHLEQYHLLLDRDYATSCGLGTAPPWCDSSYEVPLDPLIWSGGAIPLKKALVSEAGEIVKNCPVAAMYYAMAVRAKHATGPPVRARRTASPARLHSGLRERRSR